MSTTEVASRAGFSSIRYALCWEDADILVEAAALSPGQSCLSIASAGDNALALLAAGAARVVAVDLNPAQLHCAALRQAALRALDHDGFLRLFNGGRDEQRPALYARLRPFLAEDAQRFWDTLPGWLEKGAGAMGKFENYFRLFREWVLPWIHPRRRVEDLLLPRTAEQRGRFYHQVWNNRRWRLLFRLFFSRTVMGRLGRDPAFFRYVEGTVADRLLARTRYALCDLEPSANPYLQWILCGRYSTALPCAWRQEHFPLLQARCKCLCLYCGSLERYLQDHPQERFAVFNLSDIFEYMSEDNAAQLVLALLNRALPGARLIYWNMLAPRRASLWFPDRLRYLETVSEAGFRRDKAFFYSRFIVEEVRG